MITFSIFYNQYFLTWYFSKRGHFIQQFSVQFVNIARDPCTTNVYRDLQGLCWEIGVRRFQIYCDCIYRVVRQWWISKTCRKPAGNLPETCRKPAGNLPETCQNLFCFWQVSGRFPAGFRSIDNPSTWNSCNFEISTFWFPCKSCRDFDFTGIPNIKCREIM